MVSNYQYAWFRNILLLLLTSTSVYSLLQLKLSSIIGALFPNPINQPPCEALANQRSNHSHIQSQLHYICTVKWLIRNRITWASEQVMQLNNVWTYRYIGTTINTLNSSFFSVLQTSLLWFRNSTLFHIYKPHV